MPRSYESNSGRESRICRRAGLSGRRLSAAFSLFEVLVVLVIVGLVSGICMTMVSQLRRNLERFFPASEYYARFEVRTSMYSNTVASLVPSRLPNNAFKGDPTTMSGLATYFPADPWPNEQRIRLGIALENGASLVKGERLDAKGAVQTNFSYFSLLCERASFSYLNQELQWLDRWEQQKEFPYLPLAVRFTCEGGTQPLHVIVAIEREGHAIMTDVNIMQMGR